MTPRVDVNRCRTLLSALSTNRSDEEITQLRDGAYQLAAALAESFLDFRARALEQGLGTLAPVDLVLHAMKEQIGEDWDSEDYLDDDDSDRGAPDYLRIIGDIGEGEPV